MKTPEKIYLYPYSTDGIYEVETKPLEGTVEYTRTDAFIEKACEFIETYPHLFMGVLISEVIEDFKKYMDE